MNETILETLTVIKNATVLIFVIEISRIFAPFASWVYDKIAMKLQARKAQREMIEESEDDEAHED